MGIDIRLPPINGTDKEMRSYLFQLAQQLQLALNDINTSNVTVVTPTPKSFSATAPNYGTALTAEDGEATFASIKDLIIKSAEIVDAYYEQINKRLTSVYVAASDFGTFKEEITQDIVGNSTMIEQNFTNLQEISSDVVAVDVDLQGTKADTEASLKEIANGVVQLDSELSGINANISSEIAAIKTELQALNFSLVEVTANIKSGLLYYNTDGVPVYGLEVGQRNVIDGVEVFNKFARFTAGRLSFYDQNGAEVAYISDYKLYITHAEVTGTLKLGGYLVETTNGLAFKWVGRS